MKTRFLTIALFGLLTLGAISCAEEEIAPSNDQELLQDSQVSAKGTGGISQRR